MEAVATAGLTRNYTPRFSMSSMTGEFTPGQLAAQKLGDEDPPVGENTVVDPDSAAGGDAAGMMGVGYAMQTGPTRYAPMQTQPGRSITAKSARMQYPTSAYTVYTTRGRKPNVETTVTQAWDYTVVSKVNTVGFFVWVLGGGKFADVCRLRRRRNRMICRSF